MTILIYLVGAVLTVFAAVAVRMKRRLRRQKWEALPIVLDTSGVAGFPPTLAGLLQKHFKAVGGLPRPDKAKWTMSIVEYATHASERDKVRILSGEDSGKEVPAKVFSLVYVVRDPRGREVTAPTGIEQYVRIDELGEKGCLILAGWIEAVALSAAYRAGYRRRHDGPWYYAAA